MENQIERRWAMATHLSLLTGAITPIFGIIAPIILWQMKRKESRLIDEQGREAVNFMLTSGLYALALIAVSFVWGEIPATSLSAGIPASLSCVMAVAVILGFYSISMPVIAAIKCWNGEAFRYPGSIRFLKQES